MVHKPTIVETVASAEEKAAPTVPGGSQSPTDVNGGKTVEGDGGNKKKKGQNRKKEMGEIDEVHSLEKDLQLGLPSQDVRILTDWHFHVS
ncbi:hypothetical protein MLD38_017835 [Melastoma candidum]|uniref:Uncharacterized protein n=1 Tax=Melastoma candidum TaxID=119954 RepID=A0ACB9QW01_9MYRT|nr:hypothetical protein MLD38_017835 [Melastoma candidum]